MGTDEGSESRRLTDSQASRSISTLTGVVDRQSSGTSGLTSRGDRGVVDGLTGDEVSD